MRVPISARVWADGAARRLWLVGGPPTQCPKGVEAVTAATTEEGHLDLAEALRALAEREINAVLLECGPQLAGAFLQQGLVDEIVAYIAPMLLGHDARPLALLPGMERLSQALHLQWQDVRQIGRDLRVTAVPIPA